MVHNNMVKLLLLAAAAAATAAKSTACNKDNCLRAISGSAFPGRAGTTDCASYLLTTVTPATSTKTVTVTVSPILTRSLTTTNTGTEIDTTTITNTATVTSDQTITSTATDVDIVTETITIPATKTVGVGGPGKKHKRDINERKPVPEIAIAPRQVTVVHSVIPSYASACSGSVRYSSACSCLGVTKSTTTAPTPVTTKTVTATNPHSLVLTQTVSATITKLNTETDSATVTSIFTENTAVTTTVDVPTAVSQTVIVATQTIGPCGVTPTIILIAYGSGTSFDGQFVQVVDNNDILGDKVVVFTPDPTLASHLQIDAAGHLGYNGYYANIDPGLQLAFLYFDTPAVITSHFEAYAVCSVSAAGMLHCNDAGSTLFQLYPNPQSLGDVGDGLMIGQFIGEGYKPIFFEAVCVS